MVIRLKNNSYPTDYINNVIGKYERKKSHLIIKDNNETSLTKYITLPYICFKNTFISNLITSEEKRFKLVYSCERKISNLLDRFKDKVKHQNQPIWYTCINVTVVSYVLVIQNRDLIAAYTNINMR